MEERPPEGTGFLSDVRVLELADEKGEFCGKLLAGAGADVVKVEPPDGGSTRHIGPFYQDQPHLERSLHFWHYNFGKRGVTLDIAVPQGQELLRRLVTNCDILLETFPPGYLASLGLDYPALSTLNPRLIMASITPFGQTGPDRDWKGADLVHLALGGQMMDCGYDPMPDGEHDTPPIAPQMWHASHIVGNQTILAILAALLYRESSGRGQYIVASIHFACSSCTETDVPFWVYNRLPLVRQTGRHASPQFSPPTLAQTKDGRYLYAMGRFGGGVEELIDLLEPHGMAADLKEDKYRDRSYLAKPDVTMHTRDVLRHFISRHKFADAWEHGQHHGMLWGPIRKPEENAKDSHWQEREAFFEEEHEDLGKRFTTVGTPWLSDTSPWRQGPRAPHLGEHNATVYGQELELTQEELDTLQRESVI